VLLGNVAYRAGSGFAWDADKLEPKGNSEAAKFIKPTFREGWNETDQARSTSPTRSGAHPRCASGCVGLLNQRQQLGCGLPQVVGGALATVPLGAG
jgi:hypothetical protein